MSLKQRLKLVGLVSLSALFGAGCIKNVFDVILDPSTGPNLSVMADMLAALVFGMFSGTIAAGVKLEFDDAVERRVFMTEQLARDRAPFIIDATVEVERMLAPLEQRMEIFEAKEKRKLCPNFCPPRCNVCGKGSET